ncbi:hypothetical protein D3C85_982100 [compost metagenome]
MAQDAAADVANGEGMGGIVDYPQVVDVGDAADGVHIAGIAIAVHRQYGGGLGRDGRFDLGGIEVQGLRVDVDEDRLDSVPQQRMGRGHEGIWRGDDLTGDAQRLQRRNQGQGAIGEQRDMFHAKVLAQRTFQCLVHAAAIGEYPALPDLLEVGNEVLQGWKQRACNGNRPVLHH